jgi:hypothetical protein
MKCAALSTETLTTTNLTITSLQTPTGSMSSGLNRSTMTIDIPTTNKKRPSTFLIDECDRDTVMAWGPFWVRTAPHTRYVMVAWNLGLETRLLHRIILDAPKGTDVDHINGNGLDNRRCNLRLATRSQNHANRFKKPGTTSRFKGVRFERNRWHAQIRVQYKKTYLGSFRDEIDAALAYNAAALEAFGEFARINTIPEGDK